MRIAVVVAHADDETLGCGGTLLKHGANGDELHWILVTSPLPPKFDTEFIEKRREQIKSVSAAYNMASTTVLNLPAAGLDSLPLSEVIDPVAGALHELQPERVYVVNRHDVHSDHRVVFDAVWAASKPFNNLSPWDIFTFETMSSTNMATPEALRYFSATSYCDIGDYIERKLEILELYDTEIQSAPHARSSSAVKATAQYRGSTIGVHYAEAFMTVREIW
jgi:LmbE family N-acetylglucosaminyl deacetylase